MKPLKNAKQQNTEVADYYTATELRELMNEQEIFYFDENMEDRYDYENMGDNQPRIFFENVKELKVIYDKKYECYCNVAITKKGNQIHITL